TEGAHIWLVAVQQGPGGIAAPSLAWSNPADIVYGTPLSGVQLNAAANVAGALSYNPPAGTVLAVGDGQTLSVTFTATDTVDYPNPVTQTVTINVQPAPPAITGASRVCPNSSGNTASGLD